MVGGPINHIPCFDYSIWGWAKIIIYNIRGNEHP